MSDTTAIRERVAALRREAAAALRHYAEFDARVAREDPDWEPRGDHIRNWYKRDDEELVSVLDALTAQLSAVERERDVMLAHLARFAAAADDGFLGQDTDADEGNAVADVYQWARNYAYAIAHPDSGMGRVILIDDALTAATREVRDGE